MVNSVLSDKFMIFLSLLVLPTVLIPYFFRLTPQQLSFFDIIDWTIVIIFVAEYTLKLYLAENRWQHFKSPWHIVDLIIVVIPFIQFAPALGAIPGHPSLLFRIFTFPRVIAVGSRAAIGRRKKIVPPAAPQKQPPAVITHVNSDLKITRGLSWSELQTHLNDDLEDWIDIENVSDEDFSILSRMLHISEARFKSNFVDEIYPHIDAVEKVAFIFLQSGKIRYPQDSTSYLTIARSRLVIICTQKKILTVSKHQTEQLFKYVLELAHKKIADSSFVVNMLYNIINSILTDYRSLLTEIEIEVIKIGSIPKSRLPKDFLERAYQFSKEVGRLVSNLSHFKEMLNLLSNRTIRLEGFNQQAKDALHALQETATFLNETADDIMGNLNGTIDLYINQTSFDTNKILKILAVITAISVVPSAMGGVLGMNLLDVPFEAYLWQLVLVIGIIMLLLMYTFSKLGWLKT
jgi:Mg2+ and Co2+ transporter CorA